MINETSCASRGSAGQLETSLSSRMPCAIAGAGKVEAAAAAPAEAIKVLRFMMRPSSTAGSAPPCVWRASQPSSRNRSLEFRVMLPEVRTGGKGDPTARRFAAFVWTGALNLEIKPTPQSCLSSARGRLLRRFQPPRGPRVDRHCAHGCRMSAFGYEPPWTGLVETQPSPHDLHAQITRPSAHDPRKKSIHSGSLPIGPSSALGRQNQCLI